MDNIESKVMPKVFLWMFIGLLITFLTGYVVSNNEKMLLTVFSTGSYFIFAIVEIVLVLVLSVKIKKLKPTTCKVMFMLYSFISGLTFSSIFVYYKLSSIMFIFLIAAAVFGIFSLIGYTTKIDLTKIGTFFIMALVGAILCSVVNIFIKSANLDLALSVLILVIFMGITAYDIQKIKKNLRDIPEENLAIYGALELYLDYINIFIQLLKLFGKER